jgi:hypothetical protein
VNFRNSDGEGWRVRYSEFGSEEEDDSGVGVDDEISKLVLHFRPTGYLNAAS